MHEWTRVRLTFSAMDIGTGVLTSGDTGPPIFGEIRAIQYIPSDTGKADTGLTNSGDTGTANTLYFWLLPHDDDTGGSRAIMSLRNTTTGATLSTRPLSGAGTYYPYVPAKTGIGIQTQADTGHNGVFHVAAGDRIRAKYVTVKTTSDSGNPDATRTAYIWVAS